MEPEDKFLPMLVSRYDTILYMDEMHKCHLLTVFAGKTIHDCCRMHKIDIGPALRGSDTEVERSERWTEPTFGEGPAMGFDHVILHGPGSDSVPKRTDRELSLISEYWDDDEVFDESRLACMINVTKDMDGMIVFVPDRLAYDIP